MIYLYLLAAAAAVWLAGLAFLRRVWFYRDPARGPQRKGNAIVAPADGRVVYIKPIEQGGIHAEKLGETIPLPEIAGCDLGEQEGWAIGIYMSPLDVHYNYCPFPGTVKGIHRTSARLNLPMLDLWEYVKVVWFRKMVDMFARKYHLENERNTIVLNGAGVTMAVVLIADKFVNKIKCFVDEGTQLDYSDKIGFIERGSQVDLLIFADDVDFKVGVNDQVYGGHTVIAELPATAQVTSQSTHSLDPLEGEDRQTGTEG